MSQINNFCSIDFLMIHLAIFLQLLNLTFVHITAQQTFTRSRSATETPEKSVKYIQSCQYRHQNGYC